MPHLGDWVPHHSGASGWQGRPIGQAGWGDELGQPLPQLCLFSGPQHLWASSMAQNEAIRQSQASWQVFRGLGRILKRLEFMAAGQPSSCGPRSQASHKAGRRFTLFTTGLES